ncbi:MAG: transcriptional repressor LexA [Candidatus Omnitrophica bacterium]|nr:transcriptional repressor LexA [Candidatus Omnitrophota bacterium]
MKREMFSQTELKAIRHIRNFLMHRGHMPSIRKLGRDLGYNSPRSASMIVEKLLEKGVLKRKKDGSFQFIDINFNDEFRAQTVAVPLVGIVACGVPMLAMENIEALIPVSVKLAKPQFKHFLLRANGNSMNKKGIKAGDLLLIRQQETASDGDIIVALIDDSATVKEFHKRDNTIVLMPRSTNKSHQPILLDRDFKIQGIVVTIIPEF